jgi:IS5 family transposase
VAIDTLLRLLYLKHRYQLGYESLCREVADSIGWRRFCRIALDRPLPHPTTLVKLVRRAGPGVVEKLNAALLHRLAAGKLLRARKLRSTPPWSRPTSVTRPMRICWSMRSASWVAGPAAAGEAPIGA